MPRKSSRTKLLAFSRSTDHYALAPRDRAEDLGDVVFESVLTPQPGNLNDAGSSDRIPIDLRAYIDLNAQRLQYTSKCTGRC